MQLAAVVNVCFHQDYKELSSSLSELPLNDYTASELVRLCLRHHDADNADADSDIDNDDVDADDEVVSDTCAFIFFLMLLHSKSGYSASVAFFHNRFTFYAP